VNHTDRISAARTSFRAAHARFTGRLRAAAPEAAVRRPADGGWSPAEIGWHVAAINAALAPLLSGEREAAPLPAGFVERPWQEIAASAPAKIETAGPFQPPDDVRIGEVLAALEDSARKLEAALEALTPDRGAARGFTHPALGTLTLYQVGEFATVHTDRHDAQAARILGGP
jgi:hypothetical protein